jgi:diaminohydroxyphosphoribosylaminopyrimidine deaminase / 5-amino-6-(5-phosphoribosylamino)uracil reductase
MMLDDLANMQATLALARRGLGRVWPNPAVGCVLVGDGHVVGRGWTQPGGRPHAETEALRRAGALAKGATAYVTLEPCAHQGVTGPCSDTLIEAGIGRIVVAAEDPDPRVSGRGLARLREAGLEVTTGICREEATEINLGFFLRVTQQRPMITLKLASSLDGRIAAAAGDSKWITGERARAWAHRLRASHDAVLVGSGTALADDPALTCRLPGMEDGSPVRIVADGRLRLPVSAEMVRTGHERATWVITRPGSDEGRRRALRAAGVQVIEVACGTDGRPDPRAMAQVLAERGVTRVLLEGGGELAGAFLAAGLVDRIAWFHAPRLIGADGLPSIGPLGLERVTDAPSLRLRSIRALGEDTLAEFANDGGEILPTGSGSRAGPVSRAGRRHRVQRKMN